MACAFGANLMMACYGLVTPASAFLIPQLEDPINGFGLTLEEGSWLGKKYVTYVQTWIEQACIILNIDF